MVLFLILCVLTNNTDERKLLNPFFNFCNYCKLKRINFKFYLLKFAFAVKHMWRRNATRYMTMKWVKYYILYNTSFNNDYHRWQNIVFFLVRYSIKKTVNIWSQEPCRETDNSLRGIKVTILFQKPQISGDSNI